MPHALGFFLSQAKHAARALGEAFQFVCHGNSSLHSLPTQYYRPGNDKWPADTICSIPILSKIPKTGDYLFWGGHLSIRLEMRRAQSRVRLRPVRVGSGLALRYIVQVGDVGGDLFPVSI